MNDYVNQMYPFGHDHGWTDLMKGLKGSDRLLAALMLTVAELVSFAVAMVVLFLMSSCSSPDIVESHHYYHEADTVAIQSQVDSRMSSWRARADSMVRQAIASYAGETTSNSDEREVTTEIVTTATDSLGRVIRTEQRRTERSISQQQHMLERRMIQEYDMRMRSAVDSIGSVWQKKFSSVMSHQEQNDSSVYNQQHTGDSRPWYKRWWDSVLYTIAGAVLAAAVILTVRIWRKMTGRT